MKRGFTLIEVLAVIVVIGLIAAIAAPVISDGLQTNTSKALEIQKQRIIDAAEDWSLEHLSLLPKDDGDTYNVKLSSLKKGYISINIKNPDTGRILSDETYVTITNNSGDYQYKVEIYDIPDDINTNDNLSFPLEASQPSELEIGSSVPEYTVNVDITKEDGTTQSIECSKQYILNNNEISTIDTSKTGTYSIVYTILHQNQIYKNVKTIIVK